MLVICYHHFYYDLYDLSLETFFTNDIDSVWLIDITCSIIHFNIEFINIILVYFCIDKASKIKIVMSK